MSGDPKREMLRHTLAEKLFQGLITDALTHVGQKQSANRIEFD